MKYVFDNNLSPKLVKALAWLVDVGVEVVHVRDLYGGGQKGGATPDIVWITDCAKYGWAVLTCDRSIASKPHEREALKASGLVIFFLTPGIHHLGPLEQMLHLLRVWAEVLEATQSAKAGQRWFKIKQGGKLEHFGE